jgi:site-specific DNA-methyltransferase (adenine-specific)
MQIVYKRISELKEYENNPRNNEAAVEAVANSISEFGFKVPLVVTKDNIIIAGHTRYKASHRLGLQEVPCIVADDLTEEQIKAFRLVDNKTSELATWDLEKLQVELEGLDLDMSQFGFEKAVDEEATTHEDDFDIGSELEKEPYSQVGDLYILGSHKVICGDSTKEIDFKNLLGEETIDLIVTDPPYNVDVGSKGDVIEEFDNRRILNDHMEAGDFITFLTKAFSNMEKYLKKGGATYVFHSSSSLVEFDVALRTVNLKPRQQLIWNKNTFVLGRQDYQWKHEAIYYSFKEGSAHYFINDRTNSTVIDAPYQDFKAMKKDELVALLDDMYSKLSPTVLNEAKPSRNDLHPTMKPINLIGMLIKNSSCKGELVLDPFGGSGSTLIAAHQLDRRCYLIELERNYVDVIVKRFLADKGNIEDCYLLRDGVKTPLIEIDVFINPLSEETELNSKS